MWNIHSHIITTRYAQIEGTFLVFSMSIGKSLFLVVPVWYLLYIWSMTLVNVSEGYMCQFGKTTSSIGSVGSQFCCASWKEYSAQIISFRLYILGVTLQSKIS